MTVLFIATRPSWVTKFPIPFRGALTGASAGTSTSVLTLALALVVTSIVGMGGCQSTPPVTDVSTPTSVDIDVGTVEQLLALAATRPPEQTATIYLQAATLQSQAQHWSDAADILELVDPAYLPVNLLDGYHILNARIALVQGDLDAARKSLNQVSAMPADPAVVALIEADLCASQGDFVCAANALMLVPPSQALSNAIWVYMSRAPGFAVLDGHTSANSTEPTKRGWWHLKQTMLQSSSLPDQRSRLVDWQEQWPDHPAARVPPIALANLHAAQWRPSHVGLLLPQSGPLARAGRAVRDGFLAAYLEASESQRPRISIFDSAQGTIQSHYERALTLGVELLIGPLNKPEVAQLNALSPDIPVLALNYLDDSEVRSNRLVQLGLAIEDEANTAAGQLLADGLRRLIVFHNTDDWSRRAVQQLENRWPYEITRQTFVDVRTVTEAVGRAMHVTDSQQRRSDLADLLRLDLEFLPRARGDVDAVVAWIDNTEANALVPALRFHFADGVPVYASSQTVRGARQEQLQALNGFRVSELPWYLLDDPLYQAMTSTFALDGNPFASLYALGADAYRISDRMGLIANDRNAQLLGSTGILSLQDGRIGREVTWGVIRDGKLSASPRIVSD